MADDQTYIFNRMGAYYKAGASPTLAIELGLLPIDQFHSAALTTALQTINGGSGGGQ